MRTFTQTRQLSKAEVDTNRRLDHVESTLDRFEQKYDDQLKTLIQGVQQLLAIPQKQPTFATHSRIDNLGMRGLILGKKDCLTTDAIHQEVAKYFGLKPSCLRAVSRSRSVVLPRQIAIYLVRKHTGTSFKEIGRSLGIKDHTTAIYANKKIAAAIEKGGDIKSAVDAIQKHF
jgi:chromosomal replication initiation ATPase DnaA